MLMNKILRYSFMALLAMMVGNVMAEDVFVSDFSYATGEKFTGGGDGTFTGSVAATKIQSSNAEDDALKDAYAQFITQWVNGSLTNVYWANQSVKLGTSSKDGSMTSVALGDKMTSNVKVTINVAGWGSGSNSMTLAASTGTVDDATVTLNNGEFSDFTFYITGGDATTALTISGKRMFVKSVKVETVSGTPIHIDEPAFSVAGGVYLEPQTVALTCETEGAKILYTIPAGQDPVYVDDENVTGEWYDGTPLEITRTTTIKAMAVKDGKTSGIVTAKYTIVNTTGKGTVESPFSVADALQVVAALDKSATTSESYYVKGFVVGTPDIQKKEDGTYYGNANFTIADTKGGADLLTCFRLKGLENENIESDDYVQENDEVLLVGQLQKYVKNDEETPEIKNGHIVSITRPEIVVVPEPVVEGTKIAEMDYTTAAQYPYYRMEPTNPEAGNFDVKDGALVISATAAQANMWEMQPFILDWFNIKAGNNYNIAIYMEATSDVDLWLGFGTWAGSMALYGQKANAARGWNYYTVENATAECATSENNAHILFQCGSFVGTIKIYKVELYEVESTGINNVKANVENAVRYNLAGQKVNNDYKGVVIMNGKKMLNK